MGKVVIDGKSISVPNGASISVINGVLYVNGELHTPEDDGNKLQVVVIIKGDVQGDLTVNRASVEVEGNVTGNVKTGGSARIGGSVEGSLRASGSAQLGGSVGGSVDAGGSVNCEDVGSNVSAGGSIKAKSVKGNARAGGSIRGI